VRIPDLNEIRKEGVIMSGHRNFNELREEMSPDARVRAKTKAQRMIREMPLNQLRVARNLTQEHLSKVLGVTQAAVSKMEHRADMYVSTLSDFIKAMGGRLEIRAHFPDIGDVRISEFRESRLEENKENVEGVEAGTPTASEVLEQIRVLVAAGSSAEHVIRKVREVVAIKPDSSPP
jgi:transcriptional regulator with XRE-family HTH domain